MEYDFTILQTDEAVALNLTTLNPLRVRWEVLDDSDKVAYVKQSIEQVKRIRFLSPVPEETLLTALSLNAVAIMNKEIDNSKGNDTEKPTRLTSARAWEMLEVYTFGSVKIQSQGELERALRRIKDGKIGGVSDYYYTK